ncbi:MAG: undecaprenyldiphospho-muramoylpentapeptide beta-N-acetylglucosaminyltransferase [Candidatus Aminicenantes bacterium]|nr:undecaprenyldiphospho-muramoylpentapeptide beta-N-acetylglucosaminyltransferase [Candidatus Aminicenantes bacterium]
MNPRRIVISGGGTGGHLFPALAVGRKLKEKDSAIRLTFIGSHRPIEKKLMEKHSAPFIPMKIEGIKGRGLRGLKTIVGLPWTLFRSALLLLRLKPGLVIGVGGYSSGPVVLAASWLGIPTIILEQNLVPGFTNRLLIRWVRKAVVAFENSLVHFKGKAVFLGNPVREEFHRIRPKQRSTTLTLLVFGGSQGSRVLNETMVAALPFLAAEKGRLRIFHQTGEAGFQKVKEAYVQNGFPDAEIAPFFHDMAGCFEKSDLVIGRAGATTIAELIVARKAAILVPFALASEDHQVKNAGELARVGGAEVILEKDLSPARLADRIIHYLDHPERITAMENNLTALKTDDPAGRIAELCFGLLEGKA